MSGLAGLAAGLFTWWWAKEAGRKYAWLWGLAAFLVVGLVVLELTAA